MLVFQKNVLKLLVIALLFSFTTVSYAQDGDNGESTNPRQVYLPLISTGENVQAEQVQASNGLAVGYFSGNESWTSNPYYGTRGTLFADVTGDGKADAIVVNDSGVTVRRSTGANFSGNESWTSNPYFGTRGTFFADVTGDRKADAIVVNNDKVTVRRATILP